MKKIFTTFLFTITILSIKSQDISYSNIFFNNLYPNGVFNNPGEQTHYHISNTGGGAGGAPLLDIKWWGGINMHSEGGSIKMNSSYGSLNLLQNGKVGIGISDPTANLELRIPSTGETISGMSIDVVSFNTVENLNRSTYFQVRDLGSWGQIPFIIKGSGNVGIGISNPQNKLDVNGTIHAKEVNIDLNGWADHVFKEGYDLPTLEEVERHIRDKGHLPHVPSEKEVLVNGVNLGDNQKLLLQKIEELTLYSIEQNKQIKELKKQNGDYKQESEKFKILLERIEKLESSQNDKNKN